MRLADLLGGNRIAVAVATVILAVFLGAASAQDQPNPLSDIEADLLAEVQANGIVSVIIGLSAPFSPQVANQPEAATAQEAAINATRVALIEALQQVGSAATLSNSESWVIPYVAMVVDESAYRALLESPFVTSIRPNTTAEATLAETIPIIQADDVWTLGFTGSGQTVAILDTGVAATHSSLDGRVVAEACFSQSQAPFYTSLCPNGTTTQTGAGASSPSVCAALLGSSICSHGTHVASIAAGSDATIQGVAPEANVIAVQVFSQYILSSNPLSFTSDQLAGLNFVYDQRLTYNIAAVNLSLGSQLYDAVCDIGDPAYTAMLLTLRQAGIMTVISSGNSGSNAGISFPACISHAVSVGATDDYDLRASFTDGNAALIQLFAPGVSVNAAAIGGYAVQDGTSMAAPHVAGAFALLRSAVPAATSEQILTSFKNTGVPVALSVGTVPRINVNGAFIALTGGAQPTATPTATLPPPPPNDQYTGAVVIPDVPFTVTQSGIQGATMTNDGNGCFSNSGNHVWYRYAFGGGGTRTVTANTFGSDYHTVLCYYDTFNGLPRLIIYNETSGSNGTSLIFDATSGMTYYLGISARPLVSRPATLVLNVSESPLQTYTPTRTPPSTLTPSPSATRTNTATPTTTQTASSTATATPTRTPSRTPTATNSRTPTSTPSPTFTATPTVTPLPSGSAVLVVLPEVITIGIDSEFDLTLRVYAQGHDIQNAEVYLDFFPDFMEVLSIVPITDALNTVTGSSFDNADGLIEYSAFVAGPTYPSGMFDIATIRMRSKAITGVATTIDFSRISPRVSGVYGPDGTDEFGYSQAAFLEFKAGAVVNGHVTIQGMAAANQWVWHDVSPVGGTPKVHAAWQWLDHTGTFYLGAHAVEGFPPGVYDIWVKHEQSLSSTVSNITLIEGSNDVDIPILRMGDANGDNIINIQDFSLLAAAFGSSNGQAAYNSAADFNGDGLVNIADFSLLAASFGQVGSPGGP